MALGMNLPTVVLIVADGIWTQSKLESLPIAPYPQQDLIAFLPAAIPFEISRSMADSVYQQMRQLPLFRLKIEIFFPNTCNEITYS